LQEASGAVNKKIQAILCIPLTHTQATSDSDSRQHLSIVKPASDALGNHRSVLCSRSRITGFSKYASTPASNASTAYLPFSITPHSFHHPSPPREACLSTYA